MTALTVLENSFAASSTLSTANQLVTGTGGTSGSAITILVGTATGWGEIWSQGNTGAWAAAGSMGTPTGRGWFLDASTLDGQTIAAGVWSSLMKMKASATGITVSISLNAYIYNTGVYTLIGSMTKSGYAMPSVATEPTLSTPSLSAANFPAGSKLYVDLWFNVTANTAAAGTTFGVSQGTSSGTADITTEKIVTPGYAPTPPASNTTPLVLYGSSVVSSLATADQLSKTTGGTETTKVTTSPASGSGFMEILSQGGSGTVNASLPAPSGKGWLLDLTLLEQQQFFAGLWSASFALSDAAGGGAFTSLTIRAYKKSAAGVYTSIGVMTNSSPPSITTSRHVYTIAATAFPAMVFNIGDKLYLDLFMNASAWTSDTITVYVSTSGTAGVASDMQITSPGYSPASSTIFIPRALTALIATWFRYLQVRVLMRVQNTQTLRTRTVMRTQVNKTLPVRIVERVQSTRTLVARVVMRGGTRILVVRTVMRTLKTTVNTVTRNLPVRVRVRVQRTSTLVARTVMRVQATRTLVARIVERVQATRTLVARVVMRGVTRILQVRAVMRVQRTVSLVVRTRMQQLATRTLVARVVERVQATRTLVARTVMRTLVTRTLVTRTRLRVQATRTLVARVVERTQVTRTLALRAVMRQLTTRTLQVRTKIRVASTRTLQVRVVMQAAVNLVTRTLVVRTRLRVQSTRTLVARVVERTGVSRTLD